ncbi:MAG TPA: hypothetical protein VMW55_06190 [Nitrosopumilaceae archaeon]|nr:hypothetical protein [Nitrosopumilaceae archaeon]
MKKIQLLSVVFSLIMAIALTAGPGIAYAGLDDGMGEDGSRLDESNEDESNEDESGRDAPMSDHKGNMKDDMRMKLDRYCEMSPEDQAAFLEKYPMESDHQAKMDSDHKDKIAEYCLLDEDGRKTLFEEHYATMKDTMSDHKDSMKNGLCDSKDGVECKTWDHDYNMNGTMADHKSYKALKASALTDEQKSDIKAMHMELRDLKHSMKDNSAGLDKEEIHNQFMMKTKEFSMGWLSPRHQIAAGIDAQLVECRDEYSLVLKTSNEAPICVKESTAEKLIERGIAISAI